MSILDQTCFGPFYFECAVILRNSLILSTMLTNSEAWYGLRRIEIETLEKIDTRDRPIVPNQLISADTD